jgi:hypothetical protein
MWNLLGYRGGKFHLVTEHYIIVIRSKIFLLPVHFVSQYAHWQRVGAYWQTTDPYQDICFCIACFIVEAQTEHESTNKHVFEKKLLFIFKHNI